MLPSRLKKEAAWTRAGGYFEPFGFGAFYCKFWFLCNAGALRGLARPYVIRNPTRKPNYTDWLEDAQPQATKARQYNTTILPRTTSRILPTMQKVGLGCDEVGVPGMAAVTCKKE
eukprot:scaffold5989_cov94-Cylindrotheca_fusiformis.AAC.4